MRTEARFGDVTPGAAHYESFFAKLVHPDGGRGAWIRHTVHKPPNADPTGSIWLTYFDADRPAPLAAKATFQADSVDPGDGAYLTIAGSSLGPDRVDGSIQTDALEASWNLEFESRREPLNHLSRERMYRSRLPRTKLRTPHPGAIFSGALIIGGEEIPVEGWPGMVGHNWGTEHAQRWMWLHVAGFDEGPADEYVDIGVGRVRIGPLTTPWIANGRIAAEGEELGIGGFGHVYGTEIEVEGTTVEFVLPGKNVNLRGSVSAPAERFVGWVYSDPGGGEHNVINCSVADLELKLERAGKKHARLKCTGRATLELGMPETDHGIPMQPFSDG
ncbi:MAG: hypothetical protein ACR2N5_06340 [Solirubrobacterales bacterium]